LLEALPAHLREALFAAQAQRCHRHIGRFAPSPSGPLHLGNLRTALLSWLEARLAGGEWLLRFDDLDTPRNRAGSEALAIADLDWLGLTWDGPLLRQSQRRGHYGSVLAALRRQGLVYPCRCSRRMLAHLSAPHGAWPLYPGSCRELAPQWGPSRGLLPSWRLRLPPGPLSWRELGSTPDQLCGASEVGDVVLRRADGFLAYHLATAVDELWLGISTVVRGADLWNSTGPQLALIELLGQRAPTYWHVPLVTDASGQRLAKRNGAAGLAGWRQTGGTAAGLIGRWAADFGWLPAGAELSAAELLLELKSNGRLNHLRE
jgi:glutamyl-tRNA synthetase